MSEMLDKNQQLLNWKEYPDKEKAINIQTCV